jgi:hypothetical protein
MQAVASSKAPGRYRRALSFVTRLAGFGALVFGVLTVVTSYRYNVSLGSAARGLLAQGGLAAIRAGVAVYDPCQPRFARLAPDGDGELGPDYVRFDDLLPPGRPLAAPDGTVITADAVRNERIVRSRFQFRYQPYDEPRLHELSRKYGLATLFNSAPSEFEGMVRLRGWCRDRFRRNEFQPEPDSFDALEVLDRDLHSDEPFSLAKHCDPCKFFPMLLAEVILSVGHQARRVAFDHGMVEVWSNQYRKWVVMDAELDHHYEKAGVPLSALELGDEYAAGVRPTPVRLVRGPLAERRENPTMVHLHREQLTIEDTLVWFNSHIVFDSMRNDWMTNHYFRGHPARSEACSLIYLNPNVDTPVDFFQRLRPQTRDRGDAYWTLNQTEILVRGATGPTLPLAFRTVTPNFDYYEVVVDGANPSRWTTPKFDWSLHDGVNTLSVRSVNRFGVKGIESFVRASRTAVAR